MRIIPVLDVMNGAVVRAVGGRRAEYVAWASPLTGNTDPKDITTALLARADADTLYVADLDMLRWGVSDWDRRFLSELPATTILDTGSLPLGPARPRVRSVVASEIDANAPAFVREMLSKHTCDLPPVFSVDLRDGQLLGCWQKWGARSADDVVGFVGRIVSLGFRTVILLDVATVGTSAGPSTVGLIEQLREAYPHLELFTGGGVRHRDDLKRLEDAGADGVLVASALHDGTLP